MRFVLLVLGLITIGGTLSYYLLKSPPPLETSGYTDRVSYFPGETMTVYLGANQKVTVPIHLTDPSGKIVDSLMNTITVQKSPNQKPWKDGFGWEPTFRYRVPNVRSGVYRWNHNIPFVIKARRAPIIVVHDTHTLNAYNWQGGASLYQPKESPATELSFHRAAIGIHIYSEACLDWLATDESFTHKVRFVADLDLEEWETFKGARLIILPGHSEYWTRRARVNFDRFVDSGNDALILSGNTMWWQIRVNKTKDKMVCYKKKIDPEPNPLLRTVNWWQPELKYPIEQSTGLSFKRGGMGKQAQWPGIRIAALHSPLLEETGLKRGDLLTIPTHEYDGTPILGYDEEGYPQLDRKALGFYRAEIIGFTRFKNKKQGMGTWIAFQKAPHTGSVINTGTTDWCSKRGWEGSDGELIKQITTRAIDLLLNGGSIFSPQAPSS